MGDHMQNQMDDLIQSGIEFRNAIDQFMIDKGWKTTDTLTYEQVVILIGQFCTRNRAYEQ